MRATLLACTIVALACAATSSGQSPRPPEAGLVKALEGLEAKLKQKKLSAPKRKAFHADKAKLIATYYGGATQGVTFAAVLTDLDCVATEIQRGRNVSRSAAGKFLTKAKACHKKITSDLRTGGKAPASLLSDLAKIGKELDAIASTQRKGKAFGTKATALRKVAVSFVKRHFKEKPVGGVPFAEAYRDLECADVKVEAAAIKGAAACVRRLHRELRRHMS